MDLRVGGLTNHKLQLRTASTKRVPNKLQSGKDIKISRISVSLNGEDSPIQIVFADRKSMKITIDQAKELSRAHNEGQIIKIGEDKIVNMSEAFNDLQRAIAAFD